MVYLKQVSENFPNQHCNIVCQWFVFLSTAIRQHNSSATQLCKEEPGRPTEKQNMTGRQWTAVK